jgi:hypothetical protein
MSVSEQTQRTLRRVQRPQRVEIVEHIRVLVVRRAVADLE